MCLTQGSLRQEQVCDALRYVLGCTRATVMRSTSVWRLICASDCREGERERERLFMFHFCFCVQLNFDPRPRNAPPFPKSALSALFRAFSARFSAKFCRDQSLDSALSALFFRALFRPRFSLACPVALVFCFAPRRFALGAAHRASA